MWVKAGAHVRRGITLHTPQTRVQEVREDIPLRTIVQVGQDLRRTPSQTNRLDLTINDERITDTDEIIVNEGLIPRHEGSPRT